MSGVAIYNITNLIRDRRLIEIEPLSILTISFLIFALNGLGSREAPQTFEKIDKSINREMVELKFEGERSLDRVCYYFGVNRNINFRFGYWGESGWKRFYNYKENFPYSFKWNCIDTNITTSKVGILVSKGEAFIGEIEFFDENNKTIPYSTTLQRLNDEQYIKPRQELLL